MLPFNRPFEVAPLKMAGVTKIRSAVEGLKRKSVTASIRHRRQAFGGGGCRGVWGGSQGAEAGKKEDNNLGRQRGEQSPLKPPRFSPDGLPAIKSRRTPQ